MTGTAGSGPLRARDIQSRNAQHPRGPRRDRGRPRSYTAPLASVHAVPAPGVGFSWERATKHQCVKNQKYAVSGDERSYFAEHLTTVILYDLPTSAPTHPLLEAMRQAVKRGEEDTLQIKWIEYGQLVYRESPDVSLRENETEVPGSWETYMAPGNTSMVQSPDGLHYEVKPVKSLPWQVKIVAGVSVEYVKDKNGEDADGIDYAFSVNLGKRGKEHMYSSHVKERDDCCVLQIGQVNASTNNFVPWWQNAFKEVKIDDRDTMQSLFYQYNSTGKHWPVWVEEDPLEDVLRPESEECVQRYNLVAKNGHMAWMHLEKNTNECVAVCNFELLRVEAIYMFVEDDCGDPYQKIICRVHLGGSWVGAFHLRADDPWRTPDTGNYKYLDVEVLVQMGELRSNADVKKTFQKYHALLNTTILTPDMLSCWMAEQEKPEITKCIVRFGART